MPNYGEAEYWNKRYETEENNPFDWLCSYFDVENIIKAILPDKNAKMLMVGAGNAPFSPDMYSYGNYNKIVNIDLSSVVIQQQSSKYPEQIWKVMNAINTDYPDNHFPVIIDKSLIDTLLCCSDSISKVKCFMNEMYRILNQGGRFISFSLHSVREVEDYYLNLDKEHHFLWKVRCYYLKSTRRNDTDLRKRAVSYTMIVCDKPDNHGYFPLEQSIINFKDEIVLSDEEYLILKEQADKNNIKYVYNIASTCYLKCSLYNALNIYHEMNFSTANSTTTTDSSMDKTEMILPSVKSKRYIHLNKHTLEDYDFTTSLIDEIKSEFIKEIQKNLIENQQ